LILAVALLISLLAAGTTATASPPADPRHAAVLDLGPVGYWPADDGGGTQLRDLSPIGNHGTIHHVPWKDDTGLLDFDAGFHWLQIPAHPAYQGPAFSMGGWVFLRSHLVGSSWPNRQGMLLLGNKTFLARAGVQLCIRRQELMDVVMDGKEDRLGTRQWVGTIDGERIRRSFGEPALPLQQWQHVLFTFTPDAPELPIEPSPNLAQQTTAVSIGTDGSVQGAAKHAADDSPETIWVPESSTGADPIPALRLSFSRPTEINRIRLQSPPAEADRFAAATLRFSDGSTIEIEDLHETWDKLFALKRVTWVQFEGRVNNGSTPGLNEISLHREDRLVWSEEGTVPHSVVGQEVDGTGTLYLNGQPVAEASGLVHRPINEDLRAGNDASWWHQQSLKSGSLDGSLRDLVWFNRGLSKEEVRYLHKTTVPQVTPQTFADDALVIDRFDFGDAEVAGREVTLSDWPALASEDRRSLLELLETRDRFVQQHADALLPLLREALGHAGTCRPAAAILGNLDTDAADALIRDHAVALLQTAATDSSLSSADRAESALALAALGPAAEPAVPALAEALRSLISQHGRHFPRIEEPDRNALIRALLDIAPDHPASREVLTAAVARPLLDLIDLDDDARSDLQDCVSNNDVAQFINTFRNLDATQRSPDFFTFRDIGKDGNYTGTAEADGYRYKIGTGVAWEGVEAITPDEYEKLVKEIAKDHPAAAGWRDASFPHLYRVNITRTAPDGTEQVVYLEGDRFILDGSDAKVCGWSIFIDEAGHLHVIGGQHNKPNPDYFIPGSWEAMGLTRDRDAASFPAQMYWVSKQPHSIDGFDFVGQRDNPRAIPAEYLNYMTFLQSPCRETFLYGRALAYGFQCWGMFRYDAGSQRWSAVGGDPYDIVAAAGEAHPHWPGMLHSTIRGGAPKAPTGLQRLAWAWQPPFYNFCRDNFGARFDPAGRLHLHLQISGLSRTGHNRLSSVYAWSDDMGQTFHAADGSPLQLPLTINPAPRHYAERTGTTQQWWNLWVSLIEEFGYETPRPSKNNM
jgi:hypothetical protein